MVDLDTSPLVAKKRGRSFARARSRGISQGEEVRRKDSSLPSALLALRSSPLGSSLILLLRELEKRTGTPEKEFRNIVTDRLEDIFETFN